MLEFYFKGSSSTLGNRVATFLGKSSQLCFHLLLLICICLSFPLVLGVGMWMGGGGGRGGGLDVGLIVSVPGFTYLLRISRRYTDSPVSLVLVVITFLLHFQQ